MPSSDVHPEKKIDWFIRFIAYYSNPSGFFAWTSSFRCVVFMYPTFPFFLPFPPKKGMFRGKLSDLCCCHSGEGSCDGDGERKVTVTRRRGKRPDVSQGMNKRWSSSIHLYVTIFLDDWSTYFGLDSSSLVLPLLLAFWNMRQSLHIMVE